MSGLKILVIGDEKEIIDLSGVTSQLISKVAGESFADALATRLCGETVSKEVNELGYRKVFCLSSDDKSLINSYEYLSSAIETLFSRENYDYIISYSTKLYKEIAGLVSQKIKIPVIPDVAAIEFIDTKPIFVRNIMAGRVRSLETPVSKAYVLIGSGRSKASKISNKETTIEPLKIDFRPRVRVLERKPKTASAVRIEEADIIVSVGRGFRSREDLKLAFELADLLGGQVGCSRPIAADLKWLPEERWVGLSGKKVRPKLYIALGISGQPQHIAGILDSKIVVAVNKDPNAPIFRNSDYGIVGDLYEFIPLFMKRLREILKK